jgi:predicted GIY-YIG superfamily endonuclease
MSRALQHKSCAVEGFTKRYNVTRLVYYEVFRYVNTRDRSRDRNQEMETGEEGSAD